MDNTKLSTIQKRQKLNNIFRMDNKGPGGAYHKYMICANDELGTTFPFIQFQCGPRTAPGSTRGLIDSDLLEIVRDRLSAFQEGDFACDENAKALEHVEIALMYLNKRVEDRLERQVLGTNNK